MFDYIIIALGIVSTILGAIILTSKQGFHFWRDKITKETDLSDGSNFVNRWIRGSVFLVVGIGILILFLT